MTRNVRFFVPPSLNFQFFFWIKKICSSSHPLVPVLHPKVGVWAENFVLFLVTEFSQFGHKLEANCAQLGVERQKVAGDAFDAHKLSGGVKLLRGRVFQEVGRLLIFPFFFFFKFYKKRGENFFFFFKF
jgi:hypothetical protein